MSFWKIKYSIAFFLHVYKETVDTFSFCFEFLELNQDLLTWNKERYVEAFCFFLWLVGWFVVTTVLPW